MTELFDEIKDISEAFRIVLKNKMLVDGYFDGNRYILSNENKESMFRKLKDTGSNYSVLFQQDNPYPKDFNDIKKCWYSYLGLLDNYDRNQSEIELTYIEADSIVFWVFRSYKKQEERGELLKEILHSVKLFYHISVDSKIEKGLVYNKETIRPVFIDSYTQFVDFLSSMDGKVRRNLYFRGQSNANYELFASLFREKSWIESEDKLFQDLYRECSSHFKDCKSNFEKLVEMQHYGLPTRLLDITTNPLIALYFASESNFDLHGEVIIFEPPSKLKIFPDSELAYLLSNLSKISYKKKQDIFTSASNMTITIEKFNEDISVLMNEVRKELPAFDYSPVKKELTGYYFVDAVISNERIKSQDGSFVLCGLMGHDLKKHNLNPVRYMHKGKTIVIIIVNDSKKKILRELKNIGIYHSKLFPGIESTANHLKRNALE